MKSWIELRPFTDMPFPDDPGRISGCFQKFRRGDLIGVESLSVFRANHIIDINPLTMATGHQCGTGGRAPIVHIEALKLDAVMADGIDVWRFDDF